MRILRPKDDIDLDTVDVPFFYLIGPVLGGGDWQHSMCNALHFYVGDCVIATPCRWGQDHPLSKFFVGRHGNYERQLSWEHVYIEAAYTRKRSCLIAWLPTESKTDPRKDGNPYGRDSYGELGYFRGLLESNRRFPLVLGGDSNFPGLDVIRRNFDYSYGALFPFYVNELEMVSTAGRMVKV